MADATDLKSVDRKVVWVRLPPSAPISSMLSFLDADSDEAASFNALPAFNLTYDAGLLGRGGFHTKCF